jgi:putative peptidoglycan lipid II flippase
MIMGEGRRHLALVSIVLSVVTLFSKLMGFVREQIIAKSFGVSAVTDAFVSAQFLTSVLDSLISASLAIVLVPLFTEAMVRSKEATNRLLYTVLLAVGAFYTLYAFFLWGSASFLLKIMVPGLPPESMDTAVSLAKIFGPSVALLGLTAVLTALLNVYRRFLMTALAGTAASIAVIVAYVMYGRHLSVFNLAWAVVLGNFVQVVVLAFQVRKVGASYPGGLDWHGLRRVVTLAAPLTFATTIWMVTPFLDKFLASRMEHGSIASLNYAQKLIQLPIGVITAGVSTVMFTRFSQLSSQRRFSDLGYEVARTFQAILFCMLPISVFMVMMASPIVSLAFQRGQFDYQAVRATANALVYYSIGLTPMAILPVLTMTLFSVQNTRSNVTSNLLAVVTYVIGATAFGAFMGHRGLALAYSLGQATACLVLGIVLTKLLGTRPFLLAIKSLPQTMAATGLAALGIWLASGMFVNTIGHILSALVMGSTIYVIAHFVMHSQEANWIASVIKVARMRMWGQRG